MIPKEIIAESLSFDALISEWKLEVMSTNWPGYWIMQLTQPDQPMLALLIHLDNLAAICRSLRSCIDTALNPSSYPRAKTMYVTAASCLPTQSNDKGAITVMTEWESDPILIISYFRGGHGDGNVIRQGLAIDDAMRLSDSFSQLYNGLSDKQNWKPRNWT